jgi:uncharacterized protein YktA (UPF0223 family)
MATAKLISAYRELYAVFRNTPINSSISNITKSDQYNTFKDFGKKLWNEINEFISDGSVEVGEKKDKLIAELQDIVDLNSTLLDEYITNDTISLNEDQFYNLILQSQPSIEVEFAASAAVKEVKAWKDIIQAKVSSQQGFDPFEENSKNPLYQTIVSQNPEGVESFRYKVINFFAIKGDPIGFKKSDVPQFKTEGAGQVDVSIIDYDGITHQSAATATQLNQLGFESDQVFRHWGVEQIYSFQHQDQMKKLSEYLKNGEYDNFLKYKNDLVSGRVEWTAEQDENIKSKDGQKNFIKKNLPPIIEGSRDLLGHMFYAPEVPNSTSKAINNLAYEIDKGTPDTSITNQRLYKALISQVMEAQFGNISYMDGTDHEEILSTVTDKIFMNSKSMSDNAQLNTPENIDKYITSIEYERDVFIELKEAGFINEDRIGRGFKNFNNKDRKGEAGNSVYNLVKSLTSKRKNADINTVSLLLLIQMGIDVVNLQEFTRDSQNDCDFDLVFTSSDIGYCATKASLGASIQREDEAKGKLDVIQALNFALANSEALFGLMRNFLITQAEGKRIALHEYRSEIMESGSDGEKIIKLIEDYNKCFDVERKPSESPSKENKKP